MLLFGECKLAVAEIACVAKSNTKIWLGEIVVGPKRVSRMADLLRLRWRRAQLVGRLVFRFSRGPLRSAATLELSKSPLQVRMPLTCTAQDGPGLRSQVHRDREKSNKP